MQKLGVSPLTWTYVKLLGRQLQDNIRDWDGLPNSHAWVTRSSRRLLTKAQCVGVLVSIHHRTERVELLIDDGTALVRAVVWSRSWEDEIRLGDLVRVQGKLNMDSSWADKHQSNDIQSLRELRVVCIQKLHDPNEELLHWLDTVEVSTTVYKSGQDPTTSLGDERTPQGVSDRSSTTPWDCIAARAFHELELNEAEVAAFLGRTDSTPHDHMLINTLRDLVARQRQAITHDGSDDGIVRFTFPDCLRAAIDKESTTISNPVHHATTRSLRHAFAVLRSTGLVFLEDTNLDQYIFLSSKFVLAPVVLTFLRKQPHGASIAEIAEGVLTQERFRRVSIGMLENTVQQLLQTGHLDSGDDLQRFFYNHI